eukprot:TRINITY_DN8807_c0_g1_i5.p6 TRINITY_DN8807_c0_g1~~TRINITY_DN8807_c0_g1_i5.p6  ORF type:complete len:139 (+),score=21.27 TRINITY_DN8807_c0_g1_i5:44-418(+)
MIAGGTGITPMYQVIKAILKNSQDKTKISLLFSNRTEEDILLRQELDEFAIENPKFRVYYTLSQTPKSWKFGRGHVNLQMMRNNLFRASEDSVVLLSGPVPMLEGVCYPNLQKFGFKTDSIITF